MQVSPALQQYFVEALQAPDIETPVRQLYQQYFDVIVSQICANGGTKEDGADIFQESVLVLIDKVKAKKFRGESSIKTFLSSIARNLWLFELRTRERRRKREIVYAGTEIMERPDGGTYFLKKNKHELKDLLSQLGDVCRMLLIGFYYENKSMKKMLEDHDYGNEQVLRNKKTKCMKKLKALLSANTALLEQLKNVSFYEG